MLLLAAGWAVLVVVGPSWWQLLTAAFLGVMFTQLGFLGHDVGHKQVFRSRRATYAFGVLAGNAGIGLSYGWWMDKHNRHHAHPNDLERDPDVRAGALVFDASQRRVRRGFAGAAASAQAWLFFPMLLLEGLHLHVASFRALRSGAVRTPMARGQPAARARDGVRRRGSRSSCRSGRGSPSSPCSRRSSASTWACPSRPNHKGMPVEGPDDHWDFLRRQVLTSRDVRGNPVVDVALGGLNYQVEHHLFPSMPRPSLRRAQPLVRAYCAELGIRYVETGLIASYRQALGHLDAVGRA